MAVIFVRQKKPPSCEIQINLVFRYLLTIFQAKICFYKHVEMTLSFPYFKVVQALQ